MKHLTFTAIAAVLAIPVFADDHDHEHRELGAHEHGVGHLDISFERNEIEIELEVPGADITGFEHVAESDADKAAVDAALNMLMSPLDLFVLPAAAGCRVTDAGVEIEGKGHDHHGDDHDHHDDAHDHDHDDDHGHDHDDTNTHNEYHAEYELTCSDPAAIGGIEMAYFTTFENARKLIVRIADDSGVKRHEATRDAPVLTLE